MAEHDEVARAGLKAKLTAKKLARRKKSLNEGYDTAEHACAAKERPPRLMRGGKAKQALAERDAEKDPVAGEPRPSGTSHI